MKSECKECRYYNKKKPNRYKCYCGDCPAKLRDDGHDSSSEEKHRKATKEEIEMMNSFKKLFELVKEY